MAPADSHATLLESEIMSTSDLVEDVFTRKMDKTAEIAQVNSNV